MHIAYQITAEDVERSSTLESRDVGCWAISVAGCVTFCKDEEQAKSLARELNQDEEKQSWKTR